MIIVMRENVQHIINEDDLPKYEKLGFKILKKVKESSHNPGKPKPLSKMNNAELKAIAEDLHIEIEDIDSLTNKELIAVIKTAQGNGSNDQ